MIYKIVTYIIIYFQVKAELEPRDKNGKTPLMLAQSHRHAEVVKLLQKEMKRKSHWMPPLSELWAMLFGGAGQSKGPLLFFLVSVLLWGYPMYIIRVNLQLLTVNNVIIK